MVIFSFCRLSSQHHQWQLATSPLSLQICVQNGQTTVVGVHFMLRHLLKSIFCLAGDHRLTSLLFQTGPENIMDNLCFWWIKSDCVTDRKRHFTLSNFAHQNCLFFTILQDDLLHYFVPFSDHHPRLLLRALLVFNFGLRP